MKKLLPALLAALLLLSLTACGGGPAPAASSAPTASSAPPRPPRSPPRPRNPRRRSWPPSKLRTPSPP